ncbi:MAG TPA: helicase, partial [Chloroflexaceae bacterium]|nr:helicase [Chloroflexaceae bacterium]
MKARARPPSSLHPSSCIPPAMDLVEALHTLARQRGRGDSPLVALRSVPARPGARISHLAISPGLAQAWVAVTGEPFHQHQSLALAALRRGEPLALVGGQPARQSAHLLALELLRAEAPATALLLTPDEPAAATHQASLGRIATALGEPLRVGLALGAATRAAMAAHVVVATPAALHERLLRYHDRAWAPFWSRLRLIVVAEAHSYDGLAAAHLGALLLRARRLAPGDEPPRLLATIGPVGAADEALAQIGGAAWRIIAADDTPAPGAALALWRAPGERAREAVALALGLARAGARVHLTCPAFEAPLLRALLGPDEAGISVGPTPLPAQAQVFAGLAVAAAHLRQALDGAALAALVLGDDPAERTLARLAAGDPEQLPLLDGPPPVWVAAPGNAYVAAQHLVCAASERPLAASEVEAWQAATIVPRLEQRGLLVGLPGPEPAWQPLATGEEPYAGFDLRGAGSAPAQMGDDQGGALGTLDQATFDRWAFVGAALPPLRGGYRVVARDEDGLGLTLRAAPEQRRTMPLRRCAVRVR